MKITIIGAGSAQFSLGMVKDLCLSEGLSGSHITFMDIDQERLDMIYELGTRYGKQIGSKLTFDKTTDRAAALQGADFVINTAYVLGHIVEAQMRKLAGDKYGYYHAGGFFGAYHQLRLMLDVAQDMERICPDAWLIQVGNPVYDGSTLITRETSIKTCGLCHGHYGYREIAHTLGIDPDKVTWQAPGFNHNIWLTHFIYEGKDAYPLIDEWVATKGEEYWRTHVATRTHDAQMSRGAIHQYHLYGLMPIGDTVRRGGWWYHTDIATKKRWFGEPWGGPDTHLARPFFVENLEKRIAEYKRWAGDPKVDLVKEVGTEKTREQIVPIIDGLVNNNEGYFQVNVPNHGALPDIPDDVVVEVPAIVNQKGIQPVRVPKLPAKIMIERIYPDWLEMERELLAFKTGDQSAMLYGALEHHQTKSYDQACAMLDEMMNLPEVKEIEDWEGMKRISDVMKYPFQGRMIYGYSDAVTMLKWPSEPEREQLMNDQAPRTVNEFARQIFATTNPQDLERLFQQIEEFAGDKMPVWLRTCLDSPKKPLRPGRSRFLWDSSAPANQPLQKFGHGFLGGSEQTIRLVFAKFCAEMGIDAGDPAEWAISFRTSTDGLNHTFLSFGDQEVEVRWAVDRWLFSLPRIYPTGRA